MTSSHRLLAARLLGLIGLLVVWGVGSRLVGDYWLPSPVQVGMRFRDELKAGKVLLDLAATSQLLAVGIFTGTALGCALACSLRLSLRVDAMVQPFITAIMSVPKLGLVPLLVLWFGIGWTPKVLLVTLTVLFIIFSLTYAGLVTVDARLMSAARVFGATTYQLTRDIVIPSVLPFILTGLQVALPWAVSAALVAEYLSAKVGIGHGIEEARQLSDSVGVFYGIVLATLLVLFFNGLLTLVRKLICRNQQ